MSLGNMVDIKRREFIIGSAAMAAGCRMSFLRSADTYTVSVLGDTHYDAEPKSVYHSHYDNSNKWAKVQNAEFERNGEMWRERCPRLLAASARLACENKTDFILQLGDIIQGDCDHAPTHKKMLSDCINLLRKPYPEKLPFLTVAGNHDFRGKDAEEAYFQFAEPFMAAEIAKLTGNASLGRVKYPFFSFMKGEDLWVFCHFHEEDLNPLCDIIDSHKNARHIFIVSHGPFTTCARTRAYRWRLGGSQNSYSSRKRLYEMLLRRHAIVLSGHTHTTTFYRHENSLGSFCEFTANSVWSSENLATAEPLHFGKDTYCAIPNLLEGAQQADLESEINFFKGSVAEYFINRGAGHYRLHVSSDCVNMSFYHGDSISSPRVFTLRNVM